MAVDVEQILKDHLIAQNLSVSAYKGTPRTGPQYDTDAVFVARYGGDPPESFLSGGKDKQLRNVFVQCWIRGESQQGTEDVADEVFDILRDASPGVLDAVKAQGEPIRLGANDDDVWRWSVNFMCMFTD